jgi:hypothetical protein
MHSTANSNGLLSLHGPSNRESITSELTSNPHSEPEIIGESPQLRDVLTQAEMVLST